MWGPVSIEGQVIQPGVRKLVELPVAELPSGTRIHINVHVYRAKKPGPCMIIMGGLHGDEINGIETVRRILTSKKLEKIKKGMVIAIPLLNVYGFNNFSRSLRDGKDVNRSFPGSKNGSLASRVAYLMTNSILPLIDFGIDFHTGGASIFNFPQLRVSEGDDKALELARIFAPPFILQNKPIPKSQRKQAMSMGKPILVYEGGESLRLDEVAIQTGVEGVLRVLNYHEMISVDVKPGSSAEYSRSTWIRASKAGIVNLLSHAGQEVKKGQRLAEIHNLDSLKRSYIHATRNCKVLAHVNNPVVSRGDALFHLVFNG
jgi:uncharacterized protein